MLHSAGIHSAAYGGGTPRIATVMEWQRARPPGPRTMWWTLNDGSRALPALDPTCAQSKAGAFSGSESRQGKSHEPCSLSCRQQANRTI